MIAKCCILTFTVRATVVSYEPKMLCNVKSSREVCGSSGFSCFDVFVPCDHEPRADGVSSVPREPAVPPTTTSSGMTTVSLLTSCSSSPTSCATLTSAAPAPSPSRRRRTTPDWWLSEHATTWWTKITTGESS